MMTETVGVVPSGKALGADIAGVDLSRPLDRGALDLIEEAWAQHLVLRFRGQAGLSLEALADFSRNFGELDRAPVRAQADMGAVFDDEHPEITVIANVVVDGKPIGGLGSYEAVWHADMTYNPLPPKGSCLYAAEIPPQGGDTSFANMYLAYETLPVSLKRVAQDLKCVHDASCNSAGELRVGFKDTSDPRETVGAVHPVVRTHPVTRKKSLFLGRRRNAYLVGLPLDESESLLDEIWSHAVRPDFVWTQVWQVGDLIMWDNRCTMHRRDSFDPATRRLLYRTQVRGEQVA